MGDAPPRLLPYRELGNALSLTDAGVDLLFDTRTGRKHQTAQEKNSPNSH